MTAVAAPLVAPLPEPDLTGWVAWLRGQIDPNWRPGEWDHENLFFVGNPDNEKTVAYWCPTRACPSIQNSTGFCSPCVRDLRASGLDAHTFAATHIPTREKGSPGRFQQRCAVERDGVHCSDPRYCLRLCLAHYRAWRRDLTRTPDLDMDVWTTTVPEPRTATKTTCVVSRCEQEKFCAKPLCYYHDAKHKREAPDQPIARWITTQTPFLYAHQFSLIPFNSVLRWEILYFLQRRDARGGKIDPTGVRSLARLLADLPHLLGADRSQLINMAMPHRKSWQNVRSHLSEALRTISLGYDRMLGIEPTDKHVWDLVAAGVASDLSKTGRRQTVGTQCNTLDFTGIAQEWLRHIALEWARHEDPLNATLRDTVKATCIASRALARRPGGGHDSSALALTDMDATVEAFRGALKEDGDLMSASTQRGLLAKFFTLLEYGRRAGLMNGIPNGFNRHRTHFISRIDPNEDEIGKAIPEYVITQLDNKLDAFGGLVPYGKLGPAEVRHMFHTVYGVLRDTGRRPREVCALRTNCLEHTDDGYDLVWNNVKGKRHRRRLPIDSDTGQIILDWLPVRQQLLAPERSANFLFPAITSDANLPHLNPSNLSKAMRTWVDELPAIDSDIPGKDGSPLPFDRTLIYPRAFRHSYAQRHADAGVAVDVLKDLMDHKQINTTMGYYTVSLKRKREAVKTMRRHVVDRSGQAAPMKSNVAYEARTVAVPFGNCIEPSNVKAGGKACPIRFQCSGCGFYRPDPSYLPAIEEHINQLRADRETVEAMGVDDFVTRNLTDQITAFQQVGANMREGLAAMDDEDRQQIEEASAVLRKARATSGRPTLPLTVINRRSSK